MSAYEIRFLSFGLVNNFWAMTNISCTGSVFCRKGLVEHPIEGELPGPGTMVRYRTRSAKWRDKVQRVGLESGEVGWRNDRSDIKPSFLSLCDPWPLTPCQQRLGRLGPTCDNSTEDVMITTNLPLSGELAKQLEDAARAQKKEPAELLQEAVKQYLEDRSWAKLMGYGQERAKTLGIKTEEDINRLIAESRSEQRAR